MIGVNLDDVKDPVGRVVSITTEATIDTIAGLTPATITVPPADLSSSAGLTVEAGTGANTFTYDGLGPSVPMVLRTGPGNDTANILASSPGGPVSLQAQGGNDIVNVSDAGTAQSVLAPITLDGGGGSTKLDLDDSADTAKRSVLVTPASVTGLAPAAINYEHLAQLQVASGAPHADFTVIPSATTTDVLIGGGSAPRAAPGNVLTMELAGSVGAALNRVSTSQGIQGSWTFANRAAVEFSRFDVLSPTVPSVGGGGGPAGGGAGGGAGPPDVEHLTQAHRAWRAGSSLARFSAVRRPPRGTRFAFTLSQAASVRLSFAQLLPGRRIGRRCVAPTPSARHRSACTRPLVRGALTGAGRAGANTVSFQGRLSPARRLARGSYTVTVIATNAAGQHSSPRTLAFTILG